MTRPRRPLKHGTRHGYKTWRCRCAECVQAQAEYVAARKERCGYATDCPVCGQFTADIFRHEARRHPKKEL